jgi:cation diffusion facilitator family transporter
MDKSSSTAAVPLTAADREKRFVALTSVVAAVLLTAMKLVAGLLTGSLGILAEALHSGLDLVAAGMTLWAVRISSQPADHEHTYGHGKFENLSALFETLLLLVTCVWIIYEACARLFGGQGPEVKVDGWAFAVVIISIVVDYSRSRALMRVAKKYNSQALEADAVHFSTDIWSSAVVLIGLVGVLIAERVGWPWLVDADSVAALGVALIVVWVSIQLGRKSISDLLDAVPGELPEKVAAAAKVDGVLAVSKVRVRRSGPELFADVTLTVSPDMGLERAHEVADAAEAAVRAKLPGTDVVVHAEPGAGQPEDVQLMVRRMAERHGVAAHGLRIYKERGRRALDLHLEVSGDLDVGQAHDKTSAFEESLRRALPDVGRIVTHIEPSGAEAVKGDGRPVDQKLILEALDELSKEEGLSCLAHDLRVRLVEGELAVSFHWSVDAGTKIREAHALTERIEQALRKKLPQLGRVVIHVEPEKKPAEPASQRSTPSA